MEANPIINQEQEKGANRLINVISVAVPIVVAVLLGIRQKADLGEWTKLLPHINAVINSVTSLLLLLGLYFIRQKNVLAHRRTMTTAFSLGGVFLVSYVIYHLTNESTSFGGQGWIRPVYYFLLISHILLSVVVLWFVLRAMLFALSGQYAKHRNVVKWAWPIWLYVSTTGVIVYWLIAPYYR